jgi:ATP/maltotriose-dependent transcriptional regulator MalT
VGVPRPWRQPATSFWAYLITALQPVAPGIGATSLSLLREPQPPPVQTVLATVLNEISAVPYEVVLALDDYHVIDAHAYLNEVMGLDLAAGDVGALEERTEGWIAALQLAALSIQGRVAARASVPRRVNRSVAPG